MKLLRTHGLWLVVFGIVFAGIVLASIQAFAAEGEPAPWDDVVVTFGTVTLAWGAVQMGLLNIFKGISIKGKPLLDADVKIWLANAAIGMAGLLIAYTQAGMSFGSAAIQALLAVLAASGIYEAGGVGNAKSPAGTE